MANLLSRTLEHPSERPAPLHVLLGSQKGAEGAVQAPWRGGTTQAKGSRNVLQGPQVALEALRHTVTLHRASVSAMLIDVKQSLMDFAEVHNAA